jgi:hypothetical protein
MGLGIILILGPTALVALLPVTLLMALGAAETRGIYWPFWFGLISCVSHSVLVGLAAIAYRDERGKWPSWWALLAVGVAVGLLASTLLSRSCNDSAAQGSDLVASLWSSWMAPG